MAENSESWQRIAEELSSALNETTNALRSASLHLERLGRSFPIKDFNERASALHYRMMVLRGEVKELWPRPQGYAQVIRFDPPAGAHIQRTIRECIVKAWLDDDWRPRPLSKPAMVEFTFNGVKVRVDRCSDDELIYRDWNRARQGFHGDVVGPHPLQELDAEILARDERIKRENEARARQREEEYRRECEEKSLRLQAEIGNEQIKLRDGAEAEWQRLVEKNTDSYGSGVARFAEKWARLMQTRLRRDGAKLEDIAERASHDADDEAITGFMYGYAVSALARCWERGEELRRWHNVKTQIKDEGERANVTGGVLNPALLSVG